MHPEVSVPASDPAPGLTVVAAGAIGRGMHPVLYRLFLAWCIVSSSVRVLLRRLVRGPAEPSWSLPFEVAVDVTRRFMQHGFGQAQAGVSINDAATPRDPRVMRVVGLTYDRLGGLPAEVHTPKDWRQGDPTLLYWHGGGYISCSPRTHRDLVSRIAYHSGARCIVPNYMKAPAHPFPHALDAAVSCFLQLLESGVAPSTVLVGGDSAGAGLSLAMMLRLRAKGAPLPRAALLLSPWVDLTGSGESVRGTRLDILDGDMIALAATLYAGAATLTDPHVSPLHADLAGLPPLLVQTGEHEVFFSENHHFVERARLAGVPVTHEVSPGMTHVFQTLAMLDRRGRSAVRSIGAFVRANTERAAR
jgi:monoterpene epsilon-lactone hydrolase